MFQENDLEKKSRGENRRGVSSIVLGKRREEIVKENWWGISRIVNGKFAIGEKIGGEFQGPLLESVNCIK